MASFTDNNNIKVDNDKELNINNINCEKFVKDGFVVIEDLIPVESIDMLRKHAIINYNECIEIIKNRSLTLGIGIKEGFKEIVQRHSLRYEMPYKMDMEEFSQIISENLVIKGLISNILGDNALVINKSLVISHPGSKDQGWHVDGPHLSISKDLPCHCLNVFIPLIDISIEEGPTQFRPGSQYLTRDFKKQFMLAYFSKRLRPIESPCLKRGSILLFDYRVLHRGLANTTGHSRPMLVFTYAKSWFKDLLNFPKASILTSSPESMIIENFDVDEGYVKTVKILKEDEVIDNI